ncbi:TIGR02234 family membrane protein [Nocardia vermiculata]|uniref:TIGR02234 family membrane protein n=1 Tax=Nocardia vermiculata TaxID=257274 RepID=A0A846Y081_9NOCA|nr:TIGR02234 family membrane protein [Nocardia vermiculata]NKY52906.1 TIGR02234 family membrane protein [Nocardia vermiculata]
MTNSESEPVQQNPSEVAKPHGAAGTGSPVVVGGAADPDRFVPDADGEASAAAGRTRSARPVLPVVLLAVGAAALWGSSRMTWVTLHSSDGLTEPRTQDLNGGLWFGALTPLALVLLASIAAVFATKGWLRRLVGVVVALVAAVAAVPGLALLADRGDVAGRAASLAELPARAHVDEALAATFPAVLSVLGAVAAFVAGVLLARMPEATARMTGKYDNPVFRRAEAAEQVAEMRRADSAPQPAGGGAATEQPDPGELSQRVLWDALDAGADPTDDGGDRGGDTGYPGGNGTGPAGRAEDADGAGSDPGGTGRAR